MKPLPRYLATLLCGTTMVASHACGRELDAPEVPPRPVRFEVVQASSGQSTRVFTGVARADAEVTLSFRVAGTVTDFGVVVGDRVVPGDLIAQLDPSDYELLVKEAEAGLRQAEAQAANATADLRRVRGLYETNAASRDDYDAATAGAASAAAQVQALTQRLEMARRQVGYTRLVAPDRGAIAEVRVERNENVAAGQAVAVMTTGGPVEVELVVPEGAIARISRGQAAQVAFDAIANRTFAGRVTEVGVTSGRMATTFPVTIALGADTSGILPGMAASVSLEFDEASPTTTVVVPSNAVGEDRAGQFVFVVEPTGAGLGLARRRPVTVGALVQDGIEIRSGLAPGDWLVTAGVAQLTDGERVAIADTTER